MHKEKGPLNLEETLNKYRNGSSRKLRGVPVLSGRGVLRQCIMIR